MFAHTIGLLQNPAVVEAPILRSLILLPAFSTVRPSAWREGSSLFAEEGAWRSNRPPNNLVQLVLGVFCQSLEAELLLIAIAEVKGFLLQTSCAGNMMGRVDRLGT